MRRVCYKNREVTLSYLDIESLGPLIVALHLKRVKAHINLDNAIPIGAQTVG